MRAAATSGRSCSAARTLFFEADAVAVEKPPNRPKPRLLLTFFEQTALDLFQCQVGLLPNQRKQPFLMLLQRRPALTLVGFGLKAAGLPPALRPADCRRIPNHKLSCRRPRRRATFNNPDHSNSQIVRIPHCQPPQPEKATESYSRLNGNPFDSQKMENALERLSHRALACFLRSHRRKRIASFSEVLMVRVLCLLLAMILSGTCSALEIRRVAACSGVVLRLRGDFRDGDYARFKSQFRKKVAVIGLDLSSDGGDLEEGVQIANLAREKKLSVYVAEECNSICAFVFFSAAKRYLAQNSRIGVHSMSNSRDIEDLSSMRLTLKVARLSAKLGAPQSAIAKLVTTRPSNITYLDGDDLSALGTSVGNPFHYQRPEKASGAAEEQQQGCSG